MLLLYLQMLHTQEEKSKFEQLYLTYRDVMMSVAMNILKDQHLAEDAVHQAFLKVIPHLKKIGDLNSHQTKAYLVIIVRNLAIDSFNAQKKIGIIPLENMPNLNKSNEDIVSHVEYEEILAVMQALPTIHRDVLYLMYCEDMTVKEIAKSLGISVNAAKKRLERARGVLMQQLLERGIVDA